MRLILSLFCVSYALAAVQVEPVWGSTANVLDAAKLDLWRSLLHVRPIEA
jgi:hypothetical protein